MQPVQLNIPGFEEVQTVVARDQPEYIPLPAVRFISKEGRGLVTRWTFTEEERKAVAAGADVWVSHLTSGGPLQPLSLSVDCPVELIGPSS